MHWIFILKARYLLSVLCVNNFCSIFRISTNSFYTFMIDTKMHSNCFSCPFLARAPSYSRFEPFSLRCSSYCKSAGVDMRCRNLAGHNNLIRFSQDYTPLNHLCLAAATNLCPLLQLLSKDVISILFISHGTNTTYS